jgi:hypothetical protein
MKILKLDTEAYKYMEQKYYKNTLSGLVGKIFDMNEEKLNPKELPGQARCRYCH